MFCESFKYKPLHGYPLWITAKRYWLSEFELWAEDPNALTLILCHSTSFHKETWEPTLEELFQLISLNVKGLKVNEAWAIDCPNHGEAATLNEEVLRGPEFFDNFTCQKYAQAVHIFLSAGPDQGAKVDFRKRKLVGIGHSLGAVAMTILQNMQPTIPFSSLIIIEPMLSPAGPEHLHPLRLKLIKAAYQRRDVWPSRKDALNDLRVTILRKAGWHPKVLDRFVEYGFRLHPGSKYTLAPYNGVTLACTREQEANMYRDEDGPTTPVPILNEVCAKMSIHLIHGTEDSEKLFIPNSAREALVDPASGRRFASYTRLQAGHLIPQQIPGELARALYNCLLSTNNALPRAKL